MKKRVGKILVAISLMVVMLMHSFAVSAAATTIATNGNQKIKVTVTVKDEANMAVEGAEVTLFAADTDLLSIFAKNTKLEIKANTDNKGVATFKISSTYDRIKGYSVAKDGYVTTSESLNDKIGVTGLFGYAKERNYKVSGLSKVTYEVAFKNASGAVIKTDIVKAGQAAVAPETVEYDGDSNLYMAFDGWDKAFNNITSDMTVNAQFVPATAPDKARTILILDLPEGLKYDSVPLTNDSVPFNDIFANRNVAEGEDGFVPGTDKTIDASVDYAYAVKYNKFVGNTKKYNSSIVNYNGKKSVRVEQNGVAAIASIEQDDIDWNRVVRGAYLKDNPNNNTLKTYGTATWTKEYQVRFYDAAGNVIDTQWIKEGESVTAPEAPEYNGDSDYIKSFVAWDKAEELKSVVASLDVKPVYENAKLKTEYFHFRVKKPEEVLAKLGATGDAYIPINNTGSAQYLNLNHSAKSFVEDKDGKVMIDGKEFSIENFINKDNLMKVVASNSYVSLDVEKINNNTDAVLTLTSGGKKYKALLSDVDWNKLSNTFYGTVNWEVVE